MNLNMTSANEAFAISGTHFPIASQKAPAQTRQRLGLRRPPATFGPAAAQKAPADWRSPKPGGSMTGCKEIRRVKNITMRVSRICGRMVPALLVTCLAATLPVSAQTTNATSFAAFQLISERNIFNQSRVPQERAVQPTRVPDSFSLVGTLLYAGGDVAFFNGTSGEFRKALNVGGDIAGFKVTTITLNGVTLTDGTNQMVLKVSTQMRRGDNGGWSVSTEPVAYSSVASSFSGASERTFSRSRHHSSNQSSFPAAAGTTPDTPVPPGGASSALEQLMQRRAQEEQQLGQRQ